MRTNQIFFVAVLFVAVLLGYREAGAADDGSSFARTVKSLQESFDKTIQDNAALTSENDNLKKVISDMRRELSDLQASKDKIGRLEAENAALQKSMQENIVKLGQVMKKSDEQGAAVQMYMKKIESIQSASGSEKEKYEKLLNEERGKFEVEKVKIGKKAAEMEQAYAKEKGNFDKKAVEMEQKLVAEKANLDKKAVEMEQKLAAEKGNLDKRAAEIEKKYASKKDENIGSLQKMVSNLTAETEKTRIETGKLHYNLGNMYFRSGDYDKVAYEYECALQLMPKDPDTYYNLAVIYDFHLNDNAKAMKLYEENLRLNPNSNLSSFVKERIASTGLEAKIAH